MLLGRNQNVVRYLDFCFSPELAYVIMEPLTGPELFEYLEEHAPVTEVFCRRTMAQILSALDYVHTSMNLIHRDVKPENLRFRRSEAQELVLYDFGLSCGADDKDRLTDVVGTQLYMAPEIFSFNYGMQVDIWSAGVSMYIMVAGLVPWNVKSEHGFPLGKAVHTGQAASSAILNLEKRGVPQLAVSLLKGLLEINPASRLTARDALQQKWFDAPDSELADAGSMVKFLELAGRTYGAARLQSAVAPRCS
jgi:serine/threonine protein kinase